MLLLRREFFDGPACPELVLLHYSVNEARSGRTLARATRVVPAGVDGRREVTLFLPDPPPDAPSVLRYAFSTVSGGREWFSPAFDLDLASLGESDGLCRADEIPPGNLAPCAGLDRFRLAVPLEASRDGAAVRYGFGAMRKKPSEALCRATLPPGPAVPVVEAPEALSVLKARPMPYFFYYVDPVDGGLRQRKVAPVRIAFTDETGDVVSARILWGDAAWLAPNLTVMEAKRYGDAPWGAAGHFFAEDRDDYLARRAVALSERPLPRTFEGFITGLAGSEAEYCFQLLIRRPDGSIGAEWRNREGGGNWRVIF
jgi:hypothetical protein